MQSTIVLCCLLLMKEFIISIALSKNFRDLGFCRRNLCSIESNVSVRSNNEQAKTLLRSIVFLKILLQKKIASIVE